MIPGGWAKNQGFLNDQVFYCKQQGNNSLVLVHQYISGELGGHGGVSHSPNASVIVLSVITGPRLPGCLVADL